MGVEQARTGQVDWVPSRDSAAFSYSRTKGQDGVRASFQMPRNSHVWTVGTATIALVGEVYDASDVVPTLYARGGLEALTTLDGSFLFFVADEASGKAWVVNDHIGTRAAYVWDAGDTTVVTNTLAAGPRSQSSIDPAGVCAYLANDGTRGGLTPWASAKALPAASVLALHNGHAPVRYWQMTVAPERASVDELVPEMYDLMGKAVTRRLAPFGNAPIILSLSGGVDSKGLLGLLLDQVPVDRVTAYTYYQGEQVGDMDLPEARRAAQAAGIAHHPVLGYRGDFLATLVDNAIGGDGVAHFCDDADVWSHLAEGATGDRVVVAGDRQSHHVGRLPDDLPVPTLLQLISLFPPNVIDWFVGELPAEARDAMVEGWGSSYDALVTRYSTPDGWRVASLPAYLEQRANPTLTLWRERFSSRAGSVISPYLDRDLLDFVGRLPLEFNDLEGEFLHRITLERAFPRLFEAGNAHGGWNTPDWGEEIRGSASTLRRLIVAIDSPLEALVPKESTLALLDMVATGESPVRAATSGWKWQIRKLVKASELLTRLVRERKLQQRLRAPMKVGEAALLRRLLTLHLALADHSAVMERFEEVRDE
jgi:asparagine synthase (glutamine-hydrolysing)